MDYESVLSEIGQFGHWQKIVFALICVISFFEAFNTFGFTFIGFTPDFRCVVDYCDADPPNYNEDFLEFSIPKEGEKFSGCKRYVTKNGQNESFCFQDLFTSVEEVCREHVYDDSVFKNSFVAEFDLSPCDSDPDWPFGVRMQHHLNSYETTCLQ